MTQSRSLHLALACALLILPGCAAYYQAHNSSPWENGGGARANPGFAVGSAGLTLHPVLGYTYLSFEGGHDALWELGGQVRKPFGSGFWLGAEAVAARLSTVYGDAYTSEDYSSNGWALTALVGVPVSRSRWNASVFAGAGISHYTGDMGKNIRVGLDFQPWFLKRQ